MKRDSRLSRVLHILLHMTEAQGPLTSEALAQAMSTNPVVIRRILAGLREQGYVRSEKGHRGGWTLAQNPKNISLREVYTALGEPVLMALSKQEEAPGCLVEQAVNAALNDAFEQAETLILQRFGEVTIATLAEDFHNRLEACGGKRLGETSHHAV